MYKQIVPNLISYDTSLKRIKGFYYSENFDFYVPTPQRSKFHYKINIDNNIKIPIEYDFRNGQYFKYGKTWFYNFRRVFLDLKLKYSERDKAFSFNKQYLKIPFEIGGLKAVGSHIANLIRLDLFLKGYFTLYGCAFRYQDKNICIVGPSEIGKTTFINKMLKRGAEYIADDIVIINFEQCQIFNTPPCFNNFGRETNKELRKHFANRKENSPPKYFLDKLYLATMSTSSDFYQKYHNLFEYLLLLSFNMQESAMVQSFIFENNLGCSILKKILQIKNKNIDYEFVNVKNYNFDKLIKN